MEKNNITISEAKPHTIKKFELIESYVKTWALKLLNFEKCEGIIFIDCMSNSGVYRDVDGRIVHGTPIRVAKLINEIMGDYPTKKAYLIFNDLNEDKIKLLKSNIPQDTNNFHIITEVSDGNILIKDIAKKLFPNSKFNYLLLYDPYKASIDWDAISPYLKRSYRDLFL